MAKNRNFDNIQQRSQALSDAADSISKDNAAGVSQNAPVVASTATEEATGTGNKVSTYNETSPSKPADAYSNESDTVKMIVAHLEDYVLKMAPSKVQNANSLKDNQGMLVRTLEQLVNLTDNAEFAVCFKRLLVLVRKYEDDAFAANMRLRGISSLAKGDVYLNRYIAFLDMVCAFAVPEVRRTIILRYNVAKAAEFAKPEHRERLIEFVRAISA